ncbi:citrate lyase subunit beta/citryl-CoA lyase [Nocardia kruczakiae]|uniref:Citrate lyase subunit beta/citryl-CoA lyase n=1 Tax=Nocardia kruczakiae TaxID=261477 RepID=A0ABU1X8Q4_9NOCA|nr:CoA ester lyase [Nocardia kruczakiae]MDR7166921.1 citrate lyase subunit beta/citryl-CoA lyase [Nocardia kruczakiae]
MTAARHDSLGVATGSAAVDTAATWLFVPGDRPDRFAKAQAAGADLVVLDLEDAVAPDRKDEARDYVHQWLAGGNRSAVRINAAGTHWYAEDLAMLAQHRAIVMIPKAEEPDALLNAAAGLDSPLFIALIETARGVLNAAALADSPEVRRLAIGTFDLAAQLGIDPSDRDALAASRSALVLASAAAGLPGPIDGVTGSIDEPELLTADVNYARRLGFTGKLCIHPRQVATAAAALRPSSDEIRWATSVVEAVSADGVAVLNGQMVDKPVVDRAHRILLQAGTSPS